MSFFNRFRKQTSETQGERIEPGRADLDALDEPKEPVLGQPSGAGMNLRPNAPEANVDALSGAAPSVSGAFTAPTAPSASNPFDVPRMPSAPTTGTADAASVNPWQTFSSPSATSTGASPFPSSSAPTSAPTTGSASGSTFADLGASYGAAVGTNGTSNTNGMAGTNPASARSARRFFRSFCGFRFSGGRTLPCGIERRRCGSVPGLHGCGFRLEGRRRRSTNPDRQARAARQGRCAEAHEDGSG